MKTESVETDTETTSLGYEDTWTSRFMENRENRYLSGVHDGFLQDRFNLFGLKEKIEDFEEAYLAIQNKRATKCPETEAVVYYLIHQRYIYTKGGLSSIIEKVLNREYGKCHRIGCCEIPLIPIGLSNEPRKAGTKAYCYNCNNIYEPRGSLKQLDGCAWGTGFAHFLILTYPYHFAKKSYETYVPRIFGFKVAEEDDFDSV
ncbi:casein kinase II subunit beta [Pancytospora epiphaga]|nr:casein kinase II subunit beta [Pancytospora epiphaga]